MAGGDAVGGARAVEWLLEELRFKCGVSALWYHLLCLAEGLRLPALHLPPTTAPPAAAAATDDDDEEEAREEVLCLRQERLVTVLARAREVDAGMADAPVIYPVAVAVRQGLRFLQAQVRLHMTASKKKISVTASIDGCMPGAGRVAGLPVPAGAGRHLPVLRSYSSVARCSLASP